MKKNEWKEYENGVADVVEFLVGATGNVTRNVYLPGHNTKTKRQIDILVEVNKLAIHSSILIIDCKNYGKKLDVNDVGKFYAMVEDVQAESGWLVTTKGFSKGALAAANAYRGIKIHLMPLNELVRWRPKGTAFAHYAFKSETALEHAAKAVRAEGFRARIASAEEFGKGEPDECFLEVFRYYRPSSEGALGNDDLLVQVNKALAKAKIITFRVGATGIVIGGGTPAHRLLPLTIEGDVTDVNLNVANDEEAREQIELFRRQGMFKTGGIFYGYTPQDLDIKRPAVWPIPGLFLEEF